MMAWYKDLGGDICVHFGVWRIYVVLWFRRRGHEVRCR